MTVQRVAKIFGAVFLLIGLLGFVYTGTSMDADPVTAPKLLGLFPVNLLHNLVHLIFGVWGILASRSWDAARTYCRIGGVVYILLVALALVDPTTFGLIPIGGHNVWLHGLLGVTLVYFGFIAREPARATI